MMTFAPSAANNSTVARPIPLAPPVMIATFPASCLDICRLQCVEPRPSAGRARPGIYYIATLVGARSECDRQGFDRVRGNGRQVADLFKRDRQLDVGHLPRNLLGR